MPKLASPHPGPTAKGQPGACCLLALSMALTAIALPEAAQADPAVTPASSPQKAPLPPNPWAATLELYGFAPIRTTGDTTVRGFTAETDLWLGDLIPLIQMTASARGSLEQAASVCWRTSATTASAIPLPAPRPGACSRARPR